MEIRIHKNNSELARIGATLVLLVVTGCSAGSVQAHHASRARSQHSRLAEKSLGPSEERGTALGPSHIVTSSWYGPGYTGQRTASGERFDPHRLTAASKTLPLGTNVRVTNPQNGHSAQVKINDRGPAVGDRSLDLSPAAARKIGITKAGVAPVEITPVSER